MLAFCVAATAHAQVLFNEEGYRIDRYRAPLPDTAPGAITVDTAALKHLIERGSPVLIDVQAIAVRPETADFGLDWLPASQRFHIPGSTWLPNVGYGELNPQMLSFFRRALLELTAGDVGQALVFYCVADCWMSWNALKRANSMGYQRLYWYPLGTDGWSSQGLPVVEASPRPLT